MSITSYLVDEIENANALGEIELGDDEFRELAEIRAASGQPTGSGIQRLRRFLETHQRLAKKIGERLICKSFVFLDKELDKYDKIKSTRPLSESEKRYGQQELVALVNSVVALCRSRQ